MALIDDMAISGHAYYAREFGAGLRACERILRSKNGGAVDEEKVRRNRTWYTPLLSTLVRSADFLPISLLPAAEGWTTFNPSIAVDGTGGLLAIVRSSNYRVTQDGVYATPPGDSGVIKTRNILARLGPRGEVIRSDVIYGPGYEASDFPIEGMEDLRLWRDPAGGWRVTGTVCDFPGTGGCRRLAAASLLPDVALLCDFRLFAETVPGRHEKNWQPIEGTAAMLYSNWEDGWTATTRDGTLLPDRRPAPWVARGFRGGSQVIRWPQGGYLSVVHEVAHLGHRRAYEHRFVHYDESLAIDAVSDPFVFQRHRGIEFCAGAAVLGDRLVLSFGDNDETAWLAFCDVRLVEQSLRDP